MAIQIIKQDDGSDINALPLAMIAPTSDDYHLKPGDQVLWHATFSDHEAEVMEVLPATPFAPERVSLHITEWNPVIRYITVHADRCTILLTAEVAAVDNGE